MDKLAHFLVGLSLASALRLFGAQKLLALGLVVVVGAGKEVRDAHGHGTPEVADAAWTIAGGIVGTLAADPNDRQEYRDTHHAPPWTPNAFALAEVDTLAQCLGIPAHPLRWSLTGPRAEPGEGYTIGVHVYLSDTTSAGMIRHEATHALTGIGHGDPRETAVFVARCHNWPIR